MFNCKCFPTFIKKKKKCLEIPNNTIKLKKFRIKEIDNIELLYKLELIEESAKSIIYKATKNEQLYIIKTNRTIRHKKNISREIRILKKLKHPRIINIIDYYQDINKGQIYLVMDYFQQDLFQYLQKNNYKLIESDLFQICQTILSILVFCQKNKIVHLDLKPENLVINNNDLNTLTLIDFDFAIKMPKKNQPRPLLTTIGTRDYMSPEMALNYKFYYNSDIWSLGIILFVCYGTYFSKKSIINPINNFQVYIDSIPSLQVSNNLKFILEKMLVIDPVARYDAIRLDKYVQALTFFKKNLSDNEKAAYISNIINNVSI